MSRSGKVYMQEEYAGILRQDENGYSFTYNPSYLSSVNSIPISHTLPLRKEPYHSTIILPFFDGLIPEGWFLEMEADVQHLNVRDRMGLLLSLCRDCIGAVSIMPLEEANHE